MRQSEARAALWEALDAFEDELAEQEGRLFLGRGPSAWTDTGVRHQAEQVAAQEGRETDEVIGSAARRSLRRGVPATVDRGERATRPARRRPAPALARARPAQREDEKRRDQGREKGTHRAGASPNAHA